MISRRNIRVKVMQALYAIRAEEGKALVMGDAKRLLTKHFDQTISLFTWLIYVIVETARYAETDAHLKASKHRPTAEDLNVPTKIAGNELLWKMRESPFYKEAVAEYKPRLDDNDDWIKKLYTQLLESTPYAVYNTEQGRDKKSEREILEYIFTDLMLANESFTDSAEYQYNNWDDDADMLRLLVMHFLQKPNSFKVDDMISREKREFARLLLETTEERKEQLAELIKPKLRNWDADRIALLDMILMEMGTAEFLYFETIPPKVTINEYIDLAKAYSTPQSGQFVNGILDNIRKDLEANNQLNKVAYKKA
ncbi:MAG: transcription antitermination factor NusB [Bacteroidota bacterium]